MALLLEILLFIVVIVVLILVHELGHFIVAKLSGMRVDEFGIGYPPRALTIGKIGDTEYTLNWLPFGGFVRIYGEDGAVEEGAEGEKAPHARGKSFASKPRILQALVLISGVAMNVLLAYALFTTTLILGTQQELTPPQIAQAKDANAVIAEVRPGSPADKAGFKAGDLIKGEYLKTKQYGESYEDNLAQAYTTLIASDATSDPITFTIDRNGKTLTIVATPQTGIIPSAPLRPALGFTVTEVGTIKTPVSKAFGQGVIYTWNEIKQTAVGLYDFFKNIVLLKADLSQVTGPVGIAGAVGAATSRGLSALLALAAIISVNLALINLIPIPALDGGRLLFVAIEAIIRRPINAKISERVNMVGFTLLLILMVVVTGHDIFTLFR